MYSLLSISDLTVKFSAFNVSDLISEPLITASVLFKLIFLELIVVLLFFSFLYISFSLF
ncbi:hypothetical protein [Streptobacillus moniliformis]|uniref:hypothetical protein n=1 Tax=Streptobacillus moniliformis TaxID=34105 RepID=UPI000AC23A1C|nr:hypothetical protein [Streptobacillus moniliformis]